MSAVALVFAAVTASLHSLHWAVVVEGLDHTRLTEGATVYIFDRGEDCNSGRSFGFGHSAFVYCSADKTAVKHRHQAPAFDRQVMLVEEVVESADEGEAEACCAAGADV